MLSVESRERRHEVRGNETLPFVVGASTKFRDESKKESGVCAAEYVFIIFYPKNHHLR